MNSAGFNRQVFSFFIFTRLACLLIVKSMTLKSEYNDFTITAKNQRRQSIFSFVCGMRKTPENVSRENPRKEGSENPIHIVPWQDPNQGPWETECEERYQDEPILGPL